MKIAFFDIQAWEHEKIEEMVYTPHIAFSSKEALVRIFDTTLENITCFTRGNCQNSLTN
jgi:lactate dehydrogenase-like 2-hydroxyacid dehydrogenase